ncbi:MAG: hypothetical protein IPN17_29115 [Deltaproteobacteria bacterium]|nr:hypothetical protein [Deltaproteobacteria bacterium]
MGPRVDVVTPVDVLTDVPVTRDVPATDAGMTRMGSCDLDAGAPLNLLPPITSTRPGSDAGATLAYAMLTNNLQGAPQIALPTGGGDGSVVPGCPTADSVRSPPTRIYRYQVVEGGTVTATTNTQHCTNFDTRVYAIWSCKAQDLAQPATCGDDLSDSTDTLRCPACGMAPDAGGNCSTLLSTIETPASQPMRRGEVVFFAVTCYNISPGLYPHRLWVGENAAHIEPFPPRPGRRRSTAAPARKAPRRRGRCSSRTRSRGETSPPTVSTQGGGSSSFLGGRDQLPTGSYSGVSMQLRIASWNLSTAAGCPRDMVRAVFELIVGGSMVTTFSIPATLAPPVTVTVPYTAFSPTVLTRVAAGMPIELRLREVLPQPACLTINLESAPGASAITLYGG